jgi:redox-regulated HSP33 family molecular chaperone
MDAVRAVVVAAAAVAAATLTSKHCDVTQSAYMCPDCAAAVLLAAEV